MIKQLHNIFQLDQCQTSITTELLAGLTTFLTMSYIIFVNPQILSTTGMNLGAVFVATCLVAALGSLLTGLLTNYPIAIAPGMALNVYFSYVIVQSLGYSWQSALGAVLISGLIFLILTLTKIRRFIIESIPNSINIGLSIGIGIFIALLALKNGSIVSANPNTIIMLNPMKSISTLLFFLGFFMITILDYFKVLGSIIISIFSVTLISILLGNSQFHGFFSLPPNLAPTLGAFKIKELININGFSVIFSFLLIALFDSTGTLLGVLRLKKFKEDPQKTQKISKIHFSDSLSTIAGSFLGTSSTSPFIESASGIRAGGRTGLTAADGLGFGILSYIILKVACGKAKVINTTLILLATVFVFYFIFQS